MKVAGESRRFLLDTAATTIFNLKIQTSHMPVSGQLAVVQPIGTPPIRRDKGACGNSFHSASGRFWG